MPDSIDCCPHLRSPEMRLFVCLKTWFSPPESDGGSYLYRIPQRSCRPLAGGALRAWPPAPGDGRRDFRRAATEAVWRLSSDRSSTLAAIRFQAWRARRKAIRHFAHR